jgi:hypothetical protein
MKVKHITQICVLIAATMLFAMPSYAALVDGLVAYWKLDETSGSTAYDSTANGNDGTINGNMTLGAAGQFGTAYGFDGDGDYVYRAVSDFQSGVYAGAVTAWIKTIAGGKILSSADESTMDYYWWITVWDNKLAVQKSNDGGQLTSGGTNVTDNAWHHVAVVSDGTEYTLYVDGSVETLSEQQAGANNGDWFGDVSNRDNLIIGALKRSTDDPYYFDGTMDDVAIWNRALSQADIDYLQNNPVPEPASALFALAGLGLAIRRKRRRS